jgi:hypothetical protein
MQKFKHMANGLGIIVSRMNISFLAAYTILITLLW